MTPEEEDEDSASKKFTNLGFQMDVLIGEASIRDLAWMALGLARLNASLMTKAMEIGTKMNEER